MDHELRPITEDEFEAFRTAVNRGFGHDPTSGDEMLEAARITTDFGRTRAVFDQDRIVGTSGAYRFELTVPGGTVASSGLTAVTVASTHRRRGLLNAMIEAHFEDAEDRGEPVSILWASETVIYGRYGYGSAMDLMWVDAALPSARFRHPEHPDAVRMVDVDEAEKILPDLYDRCRHQRPGMLSRSPENWKYRRFMDREDGRAGFTSKRYVVAGRNGEDVGHAVYRQKGEWDDTGPKGEIQVLDLMAVDDRAAATLWSHLASIDLFPKLTYDGGLPLDSELPMMMDNSRAVARKVGDGIWLRVLDVGAALEARRYRVPGEVDFAIVDRQRPGNDGRWRLAVGEDGRATCTRLGAGTDDGDGDGACTGDGDGAVDDGVPLLDIAALGAMYLGGRSPWALRRAGLLQGDDGALTRLDTTFAWSPLPWCPDGF